MKKKKMETANKAYEHTITCLTCGYTHAEGGFGEQSNLERDQLLAQSKHNAGCKVLSLNGLITTSSSVDETDGAVITRYIIQQM